MGKRLPQSLSAPLINAPNILENTAVLGKGQGEEYIFHPWEAHRSNIARLPETIRLGEALCSTYPKKGFLWYGHLFLNRDAPDNQFGHGHQIMTVPEVNLAAWVGNQEPKS